MKTKKKLPLSLFSKPHHQQVNSLHSLEENVSSIPNNTGINTVIVPTSLEMSTSPEVPTCENVVLRSNNDNELDEAESVVWK